MNAEKKRRGRQRGPHGPYDITSGTAKRMLEHDDFAPVFCDNPEFRHGGMYGLVIEDRDGYYWYWVVSSDTIARFLATGVIV